MRIGMKNDLDLIRAILEEVESWPDAIGREVEVAGWSEELVNRHVERLCNDGILDFSASTTNLTTGRHHFLVRDMSSAGHEFLGALRSGDVLERLKSALKPSELAALSFAELAGIAKELAAKAIRKKLGLD
jgi:hypothetical protein